MISDYDGKSNNKAINSAVQIIKTKNEGDKDILLLKKWNKLPVHLDMIRHRKQICTVFRLLGGFFIVVLFVFVIMMSFFTSSKSFVIINFRPLEIYEIKSDLFEKFEEIARSIVSDIENKFPPNASGISRLLPWNWNVEPILPGGEKEIFEILKQFSLKRFNYQNFKDLKNLFPFSTVLVSKKESDSLQKMVQDIDYRLPNLGNDSYICSRGGASSILSMFIFVIICSIFFYISPYFLRRKEKIRKKVIKKEDMIWIERILEIIKMRSRFNLSKIFSIMYFVVGYCWVIYYGESIFIYSILGLIIILPNVIGVELVNINFPKNPFIDVIEDLQPLSSPIDGLEPVEDEALKNGEEK